ncbi:MAG: YggS family pyridoxal phosphate-dependent enzyme [Treponema sp.]
MTGIADKLKIVLDGIRNAERLSGRSENSVSLLAVSKFHSSREVIEAARLGVVSFGENRVQEAAAKFSEVKKIHPNVKLHLIGQLQTNKVKKAVEIADCIESVDRLELIAEIEKQAAKIKKTMPVLLELHTGEDSKSGFPDADALEKALTHIADGNAPHVIPSGFMTMAPFTQDETLIRASFASLRQAKERLSERFPQFPLITLSMGMTGDYKIAIEEGSTQVRIGTAIFGERAYADGVSP